MKRRLFNLLAVLSLVLCFAVIVLWGRGYWIHDFVQASYKWFPEPHLRKSRWLAVKSARGLFEVAVVRNDFDLRYPAGINSEGHQPGWVERFLQRNPPGVQFEYYGGGFEPGYEYTRRPDFFGFGTEHVNSVTPARHDESWSLVLPAWLPMLICALAPLLWLKIYLRRRHQLRTNHCTHCGYDLRATPERCPECGTVSALGWTR